MHLCMLTHTLNKEQNASISVAHFNKHVEGFFRKDSQGEGSRGWHLYSTRPFLPTDVQPLSLSWKSPSVWRCLGMPQKPASLDRLVSTRSHSFSFWALFAWRTSKAYQPTKLTICEVSKQKSGLTCQVGVTVDDSGLCCCIRVMPFEC